MPNSLLRLPLVLFGLLFLSKTAQAQFTVYTNEASFLGAVSPGHYKETFQTTDVSSQPLSVNLSGSGFSYLLSSPAPAAGQGLYPGGSGSDKWVSTYWPQYGLLFTNFSTNVSAVGGYLFPTDWNRAWTNTPITVIARLTDGSSYTNSYNTTGSSSYLGLTFAAKSIQSLQILNATNAPTQEFMTVNDFTVGVAGSGGGSTPAPAPGTNEVVFDSTTMTRAGSLGFQALSYRQIGQVVVLGGSGRALEGVTFRVENYNDAAVQGANFYVKVYSVASGPAPLSAAVSVWNPLIPNSAPGFDANYPFGFIDYSRLQALEANGTIDTSTQLYHATAPGNFITWGNLKAAVAAGGNQTGVTANRLTEIATVFSGPVNLPGGKTAGSHTPTFLKFNFLEKGILLQGTHAFSIGLANVPNPGANVSLNNTVAGLSSVNIGTVYPGGTGQTPSVGSFNGNMLWDKFNQTINSTVYQAVRNGSGAITNFTGTSSTIPASTAGLFGEQVGDSGYGPFYRPILKVEAVGSLSTNAIFSSTTVNTTNLVVAGGTNVNVDQSRTSLNTQNLIVSGSGSQLTVTNGSPLTGVGLVSAVNSGVLSLTGSNSIGRLNVDSGGNVTQASGGVLQISQSSDVAGTGSITGGTIQVQGTASTNPAILTLNSTSNTARIEVLANGVLKGTGSTSGRLVFAHGGTAAPGNSPGLMSAGEAEFGESGRFSWEIDNFTGSAGTNWDRLDLTGQLFITATAASPFVVEVDSLLLSGAAGAALNFDASQAYSFAFVTTVGGISGFDPSKFTVDTTGFANAMASGGSWYVAQSGNSLTINYSPASPFQSWATGNSLTGPDALATADPDGDGWSNAQEYAFGLVPTLAGGQLTTVSGDGTKITFLQRSGVTYVVRSTTDLAAGFTGTVTALKSSPQPVGLPSGYEQYEAFFPSGTVRGFLKVEATVQP